MVMMEKLTGIRLENALIYAATTGVQNKVNSQ